MELDPWDDLNRRYRHDEHAQFLLFVEQMNEARQLLLQEKVAKQRMALVAVDNLAEMLLHRYRQRLADVRQWQDESPLTRLDQKRLKKLDNDFRARVSLAQKSLGDSLLGSLYVPLLDPLDADVFRTAHTYRNRIYHRDHHNPTLLPLIARAYFGAVGRAFVRLQPTGVAGSPTATTNAICAFGYDLEGGRFSGYFAPAEAAEAITGRLGRGLGVSLEEAKETLRSDIADRTHWAEEMVESLVGEGFARDRIEWGFGWTEFWDEIEGDSELVRLENEVARLKRDPNRSVESFTREGELMEARNRRVWKLHREFQPSIGLDDIPALREEGQRLADAEDLGTLFNRYRKIDDRVERIEQILDDLAIGWDRHIQEEVDRIRGK